MRSYYPLLIKLEDKGYYKQAVPDMRNLGCLTYIGMQVLSLEASLSAVHSERSQSDIGLKSRMQELLSELQSTLQVRLLGCSCSADMCALVHDTACLGCKALCRCPCTAC